MVRTLATSSRCYGGLSFLFLAEKDVQPPNVERTFLPMDVFEAESYKDYTYQLGQADLVVFNYLFPKINLVLKRLTTPSNTLRHLRLKAVTL